jgi:cytochrome c553
MKKLLRGLGFAAGGLFGLIAVAALALYTVTQLRFTRTVAATPAEFSRVVAADSATLARGEHLATAIGKCAECHGDDFTGKVFIDIPPLGRLVPPNLTMAGLASELTPQQWANAVRHGIRRDGRSLYFMPSEDYAAMSDDDLAALIAYFRSLPGRTKALPGTYIGPVARGLFLAGQFPILSAEKVRARGLRPTTVPEAATPEYGRYLADVGGCTGCHGPTLSGGRIPGTPAEFKPAANLTPAGIGHYSEADFVRALREGVRPGGTAIDSLMPVKYTKLMTDQEIAAVYAYLRTVPAKEFGGR